MTWNGLIINQIVNPNVLWPKVWVCLQNLDASLFQILLDVLLSFFLGLKKSFFVPLRQATLATEKRPQQTNKQTKNYWDVKRHATEWEWHKRQTRGRCIIRMRFQHQKCMILAAIGIHMSATLHGVWTLKVSRVSWCNLKLELFQMMSCMKFVYSAADLPGSWKPLRNAFPWQSLTTAQHCMKTPIYFIKVTLSWKYTHGAHTALSELVSVNPKQSKVHCTAS